jgi:predicted AlkP superfamily phosphohydrolase/phosphomutase
MAKIKQKKVSAMGGLGAIVGARPLTDDQRTDLNIHNHMALENLLNSGGLRDFEIIAALSNLAKVVDDKYFYSKKAEYIEEAQAHIKTAYELSKNRGVYLLTSDAIRAAKGLIELHDAQLGMITQREMREAVTETQRLEKIEREKRIKK